MHLNPDYQVLITCNVCDSKSICWYTDLHASACWKVLVLVMHCTDAEYTARALPGVPVKYSICTLFLRLFA